MSASMTVFFVDRTRHALGAATRGAGGGQTAKAPIQENVLARFFLESEVVQLLVPGTELSTVVADPLPSLLQDPRSFHVPQEDAPPGTEPRPQEVKPLPGLTVREVVSTSGSVKIDVTLQPPADPQKDSNVWILITGTAPPAPLIVRGIIPKGSLSVSLPIPALPAGKHPALVLVQERLPFIVSLPTPSGPPVVG